MRMGKRSSTPGLPPLVVVGALKSGGSGKTSVTAALAGLCQRHGKRVGIMCYWLQGYEKGCILKQAGNDWRASSDEATLLGSVTGEDVFVTRNRPQAWEQLALDGRYDIIFSDDGFQDLRLDSAIHLVLVGENDRPGFVDLIPCGAFRQTQAVLDKATLVLKGPLLLKENAKPVRRDCFYRRLSFPEGFSFADEYTVLCALGENRLFIKDLENCGVRVKAVFTKKDHQCFTIRDIERAQSLHPAYGLITTEKDFVKMPELPPNKLFSVVKQEIIFPEPLKLKIFRAIGLPVG
jgi:tetraacyldisaccharide 4'-kinase